MADPLQGAAPIDPTRAVGYRGGGTGAEAGHRRGDRDARAAEHKPAADAVTLGTFDAVARRLLRQRVLVRTRDALELPVGTSVPDFAETLDSEPVATFVGRLVGAQNQLAARLPQPMPAPQLRQRLDSALRAGAEEALTLLDEAPAPAATRAATTPDRDHPAARLIAEVMTEYTRLLTAT